MFFFVASFSLLPLLPITHQHLWKLLHDPLVLLVVYVRSFSFFTFPCGLIDCVCMAEACECVCVCCSLEKRFDCVLLFLLLLPAYPAVVLLLLLLLLNVLMLSMFSCLLCRAVPAAVVAAAG